MAEDGESEQSTAEEILESFEETRKQCREQVSYEWVETVRKAGELYRDTGDAESVAERLDLSSDKCREGLTVYRLIFEEGTGKASSRGFYSALGFFSPDKDIDEFSDRVDSTEDSLREYVGAFYLEYDLEEEPVGDPPFETRPNMKTGLSPLSKIADNMGFSSMLSSSGFSSLSPWKKTLAGYSLGTGTSSFLRLYREGHSNRFERFLDQILLSGPGSLSPAMASQPKSIRDIARQQRSPLERALPPQNRSFGKSFSEILKNMQPPESFLKDFASFHSSFGAVGTGYSSAVSTRNYSETIETPESTVDPDPTEAETSVDPPIAPVNLTVDATLPSPDTVTAELVFEIPVMIVEAIFNTGPTRSWFLDRSTYFQAFLVQMCIFLVTIRISGKLKWATAAVQLLTPLVLWLIIRDEDE